jgi:hypothetical protein
MKKKRNASAQLDENHSIRIAAVRTEQVRQGVFDGRYRTRSITSAKLYRRSRIKRQTP